MHKQVMTTPAMCTSAANNKGSKPPAPPAPPLQQVAKAETKNLAAIMAQVQLDYGKYKYTVYRCASKIVALQRIFQTSKIPFKLVQAILDRHGMPAASNLNLMVPPFQLTSLLHDIYFACEKLGHFTPTPGMPLESITALLANFFWNTFDPQRRHSISLLEIKVTFLLLGKLYSSEHLVGDFYALLVDSKSESVSRFAFELLLLTLGKLLTYVGEAKAYGLHNVPLMMEQCFARCPHPAAGLSEAHFHQLWTQKHARFLIYANLLALVKRLDETRHLVHSNPCSGCLAERIIGIRFRCQVCRDYSLCLPCFATGHCSGRHEHSHRMCEVFGEDVPPQRWTHYLARLCGWFAYAQKGQRAAAEDEERRGFCNNQESVSGGSSVAHNDSTLAAIPSLRRNSTLPMKKEMEQEKDKHSQAQELTSLSGLATTASNASERLQSIIDRLLQQNAKLESQINSLATTSSAQISDFLTSHQNFLLKIIEDMRQFSRSSNAAGLIPPPASLTNSTFLSASTPHRFILGPISLPPSTLASQNPQQPLSYDVYAPVGANLTHSINGADLNRSYLEANKSDYSLSDLSLWFDQRRSSAVPVSLPPSLGPLVEQSANINDTEMINFKLLLNKVKEIVEDSYSDNAELSAATQNLENVLDSIIQSEEQQRRPSS